MFQWSHGFSTMETQTSVGRRSWCGCFNGATVFQPWRRMRACPAARTLMTYQFQWSHGFSTMETRQQPLPWRRGYAGGVSMEPRFFNHGDPPRFPRGSSWALIGDFECLLCPGQKLFNSSATRRDARRVAVRLYFEHLPAFWRVLRCSKLPASDK